MSRWLAIRKVVNTKNWKEKYKLMMIGHWNIQFNLNTHLS